MDLWCLRSSNLATSRAAIVISRWTPYHRVSLYLLVSYKCTLVEALRLCTGRTAYRGSRGIGKGKVHRCTGTEALYRSYGP